MATVVLSSANVGIALNCSNELSSYYKDWLGMDKNDVRWYFTSSTLAGAILGSLLLDPMLRVTKGRRITILWAALIALFATGMMCILNKWVIMVLKFFYGVSIALILSTSTLYMAEMLPEGMMAFLGCVVNLGVTFGLSLIQLMGIYYTGSLDFTFLYISIFPPFFACLTLFTWFYAYEDEPIDFCVENKHVKHLEEEAKNNINKFYDLKDGQKERVITNIME